MRGVRGFGSKGVEAPELFEAALTNRNRLVELIKRTGNDDFARRLLDVAKVLEDSIRERLIRGFVNAMWDDVRIELGIDVREGALSLEFVRDTQRMRNRIIDSLLKNPSRFPSKPSRNEPPPDLKAQLGETLLDY
ncbi:MAG: hypothetical protein K2Y37_17990 [Pirellulales bacterium]|nr:hypothetical protein [Pirellulales bacterium]